MHPFKFASNRVWRAYEGGAQIDMLRNSPAPKNGHFPEEWIASCVPANNPGRRNTESISMALVGGKKISFTKLLSEYSEELLGRRHLVNYGISSGILTKLLDSAIRLPLQVHPDHKTAMALYNSRFGKTEAWIILKTRKINGEYPYVMLGFNEKLDKKLFMEEALTGEMSKSLQMLHRYNVSEGDVIFIEGGTVHTIGPGILLYEIMEPTDLVVQPELFCGEKKMSLQDRFGNIQPEPALNVFNFQIQRKENIRNNMFINPTIIAEDENSTLTMLLNRHKIKFFGVVKVRLKGCWKYINCEDTFCVGTVLAGMLEITTKTGRLSLKAGDSFFMPYVVKNAQFCGTAEVILAYPPLDNISD